MARVHRHDRRVWPSVTPFEPQAHPDEAGQGPGGGRRVERGTDTEQPSIAQAGAVDPTLVRLEVKENRRLPPAEVVEPG